MQSVIEGCPCPQVAAIVVTFHPDPERLDSLLGCLMQQVGQIIVCDNTPSGAAHEFRPPGAAARSPLDAVRIQQLSMGGNQGIAAAQNRGAERAIARGARYLWLLDQDSRPEPGALKTLLDTARICEEAGQPVAALAPAYRDTQTGNPGAYLVEEHADSGRQARVRAVTLPPGCVTPVAAAIASGLLIPVDAWRRVGPMREELFIDSVDTEWCLRAATTGLPVYAVTAAVLVHALGAPGPRIWLGRWVATRVRRPYRTYFIVRNALAFWLRRDLSPAWRRYGLCTGVRAACSAILCGPERFLQVRSVMRAVQDARAGRFGPRADVLERAAAHG